MKCGHMAQGHTHEGKPLCLLCLCDEVDFTTYDLDNRLAECKFCKTLIKSSIYLPGFKYQKDYLYDEWSCGCDRW